MGFCKTGRSPLTEGNLTQAKHLINDVPVSGSQMVSNLTKHEPPDSTNNTAYQKALIIAKQKEESEANDSASSKKTLPNLNKGYGVKIKKR